RTAKELVRLNAQYHFRQTLSLLEEIVRLKTGDRGQRIKRIGLGQRDHIVWNGIDPELALVEVLHHKRVAQLRDIDDSVDVFGKLSSIFQAQTISVGWDVRSL